MEVADRDVDSLAQAGLVLIEKLCEAFLFAFVFAEDGDAVRFGQLGEFLERFFDFGFELLDGLNGEVNAFDFLATDQAGHRGGGALIELAQFHGACTALGQPQHGTQGIDVFHLRQTIEIAPGLLGNFQWSPEGRRSRPQA